jgi:hypothetical protein
MITFVLTSCGRIDLLEKTLDSFFKYNQHPIERYLIIEDSADPTVFKECEKLNKKYDGVLEFIFNKKKLGQTASIDKAYSKVKTPYIFHCEEDWEFYKGGFIEDSLKVLESQPKVLQVWIRPKSDHHVSKIEAKTFLLPGDVVVRRVLPTTFVSYRNGKPNLKVENYIGFSWNPGLRRLSDYQMSPINSSYSSFEAEHQIDAAYREDGYMVVSLSKDDDDGYVRHIGWDRRVLGQEDTKVSIVMQSYLGDYPGARKEPVEKFIRAVKSFQNQNYKNKELIIVSDGCKLTLNAYEKHFKKDIQIEFVYIDKNTPTMYSKLRGRKYYRGVPRRLGVSLSSGKLISYMDSDDYLLPNFIETCVAQYQKDTSLKWWMNQSWYDHINIIDKKELQARHANIIEDNQATFKEISENEKFVQMKMDDNFFSMPPWLLVHTDDVGVDWDDSIGDISEDVKFNESLREKWKGQGFLYSDPCYVRCHYNNGWDV